MLYFRQDLRRFLTLFTSLPFRIEDFDETLADTFLHAHDSTEFVHVNMRNRSAESGMTIAAHELSRACLSVSQQWRRLP